MRGGEQGQNPIFERLSVRINNQKLRLVHRKKDLLLAIEHSLRFNMNKKTEHQCSAREETDEEMQAIGYPLPLNPAAFAWTLAEIIKRGVQNENHRRKRHLIAENKGSR